MKELAAWYQKKISSYDKEEWETMVEQLLMKGTYRRRVVDFSTQVRPYLIDVDLVRGSSFPKAKPTLGVRRVVWYALVRLVFLPALYRWWTQQTSPACARLLLALWLLQLLNIALFLLAPSTVHVETSCLWVPLGLMMVLCTVHSQIVSTTEFELGRVRPRSTYRRKLPRSFDQRNGGRDVSGGASAESGATSSHGQRSPSVKASKFRRRQSRLKDLPQDGIRKRKKNVPKVDLEKELHSSLKTSIKKTKAKDSDDEDYMSWKKPSRNTPTVTFTPPPCVSKEPPLLTRKRLEKFNVRNRIEGKAFAEGDDGFESLNGNNSNGSDGDKQTQAGLKPEIDPTSPKLPKEVNNDDSGLKSEGSSEKIFITIDEKLKTNKDVDSEEGRESPGSSNVDKRAGVRFRNSWVKEMIEKNSSEESCFRNENATNEKPDGYQSSSSDGECSASAPSIALPSHHTMSDWVGQTTNSEDSSYGGQSEECQSDNGYHCTANSWDPFAILNPASDTVKCTMWESGDMLKAQLSAVDISWYVVARAERAMATDGGYMWFGVAMAAGVALMPPLTSLVQIAMENDTRTEEELQAISVFLYLPSLILNYYSSTGSFLSLLTAAFGSNVWEFTMNITACILKFALSNLVFFLLAVAERAFKQRFLYAKLFSHLTSARRARKSELPHFRLNTVRNIKAWLSTRSYLRRRGPQRSVDVIVSAAFVLTLILLACCSAQLLRDAVTLECGWLLEALVWCVCLGVYLLRLMTLGSNVNRKYRGCLSAILTEQINLHLAIEQRPDSKEKLTLANNVLKLAADLLKELDSPFKISGICANHYLYTITKVVILSALSGVLSEMLGFKLKLHKIKIK